MQTMSMLPNGLIIKCHTPGGHRMDLLMEVNSVDSVAVAVQVRQTT